MSAGINMFPEWKNGILMKTAGQNRQIRFDCKSSYLPFYFWDNLKIKLILPFKVSNL